MAWARLVSGTAICLSIVALLVTIACAQNVKAEIEHAEDVAAKAAHTDPDHEGAATDPLSADPDLAIWTVIVFVVLLIVLKKFAWGPILESLDTREKNIANHIAQAERSHEEAKKLLAQYEQKLAAAAGDVREMLDEARRDAEQSRQGILAEAKAGAEAERARALRDIETATDQAMESLARRSAQLAVDLAGKILQSKLSAADHARLIEEAMAKFPASAPSAN
jgi:F-type H+-transporting ATPase subunit b